MCQPFDCQCGADVCFSYNMITRVFIICLLQSCLKRIEGAACLSRGELQKRGFINSYIWAMIDNHDGIKSKVGGEACLSCGYGLSPYGDQECGCKPVLPC